MNALELLKDQHDEVDALIASIEKTDDVEKRRAVFAQLADALAAHSKIEERLFYPAVMAKQTEEKLLESVEEHLSIKRLLADMMELEVEDDEFDAKLTVMKEQIEHHARKEEEKELFPKVKKLLSKEELEGLGNDMLALYEELMAAEPRRQVPSETDAAARLPT